MAQLRGSDTAVTANSARWLGGGAVALVHLAFLLALLLTDKLSLHKADPRAMMIYRIPEEPTARRSSAASIDVPSRITSLPSVAAPHLDGPMFLVRPDQPLPPSLPQILDLSVHDTSRDPTRKKTLEELGPPSKEQQLKQFFKESEEENRHARESSAGEDCEAVRTSDKEAASLGTSPIKEMIPIENVCTPRNSAKELSRRNDRFSPH